MVMREEFRQYKHMRKEMDVLQEELERMEVLTDTVKGSSTEWPYTEHTMRVQGRHANEEVRVKKQLEALAKRCRRVEDAVKRAPNSSIRCVLTLRYLRGMKWRQVADVMDEDSEDSVRKMAEGYFKECENLSGFSGFSGNSEMDVL